MAATELEMLLNDERSLISEIEQLKASYKEEMDELCLALKQTRGALVRLKASLD